MVGILSLCYTLVGILSLCYTLVGILPSCSQWWVYSLPAPSGGYSSPVCTSECGYSSPLCTSECGLSLLPAPCGGYSLLPAPCGGYSSPLCISGCYSSPLCTSGCYPGVWAQGREEEEKGVHNGEHSPSHDAKRLTTLMSERPVHGPRRGREE